MKGPCAVIVLAKAPVAGYAKTRLIPALGEAGAARLAERLLAWSIEQACQPDREPETIEHSCGTAGREAHAYRSIAAFYRAGKYSSLTNCGSLKSPPHIT